MKFDLAMAAGLMSMMNMKISDAKSEVLLDEAGPKILGYPPRHTKTVVSFTMEMSVMGMKQSNQSVNEMETWSTTKINSSAMEAWAKNFAGKSGQKEMDELMMLHTKNLKGVPLKQINVTTNTDKNGKKTVQTVVTEVTEVKEQKLPASLFKVPADYKDAMEGVMQPAADSDKGGDDDTGSSEEPKSKKGPSFSDMMKLLR